MKNKKKCFISSSNCQEQKTIVYSSTTRFMVVCGEQIKKKMKFGCSYKTQKNYVLNDIISN